MENSYTRLRLSAEAAAKQRALGLAQLVMELTGNKDSAAYQDTVDLTKQYQSDQQGKGFAGFLGSILGDPLTYAAIPAAKAATGLSGALKAGGVYGAVSGGTGATDSNSRLQNTLRDMAFGSALGAGMYGAGKVATSPTMKRLVADEFGGVGGKLPMDYASRMARAKEMGFDVDNPVYHGTNAQIEKINPDLGGGELGKGFYVTNDPNIAGQYGWGESKNIMPMFIKKENLADVNKLSTKEMNARIKKYKPESLPKVSDEQLLQRFRMGTNSLKDLGFSGAHDDNSRVASQYVVYDPSILRSIFAAFNPKKANSSDLLAMRVPLTAGLGGAAAYRGEDD